MKAIQWFPPADKAADKPRPHSPVAGVIYIPAHRVKDAARGIAYDQPGGWFAQTFSGNVQLAPGDWVITYPSGNRYVMKDVDYAPRTAETPLGRFMKKWGKK